MKKTVEEYMDMSSGNAVLVMKPLLQDLLDEVNRLNYLIIETALSMNEMAKCIDSNFHIISEKIKGDL